MAISGQPHLRPSNQNNYIARPLSWWLIVLVFVFSVDLRVNDLDIINNVFYCPTHDLEIRHLVGDGVCNLHL